MNTPSSGTTGHAQWELAEVGVTVILLAVVTLTVAYTASGVVLGFSAQPSSDQAVQSAGRALQDATSWANLAVIFPAVIAVGLLRWHIHTWIASGTGNGDGDVSGGAPHPPRVAFDHLRRARSLATWTVLLFVVTLLAVAGSVTGNFLELPGLSGLVWSDHLLSIGSGAATWAIAGAGFVVALNLRRLVDTWFAGVDGATYPRPVASDSGSAEPVSDSDP